MASVPQGPRLDAVRSEVTAWALSHHLAVRNAFGAIEVGHWLVERLVDVFAHRTPDPNSLLDPELRVAWLTFNDFEASSESPEQRLDALLEHWSTFNNPVQDIKPADLPKDWKEQVVRASLLAPVAADPARQSLKDFLSRARSHYQTRATAIAEAGVAPYRAAPELDASVRAFLRFQVCRHSAERIAKDRKTSKGAIEIAYKRAASLIDLPLRTSNSRR